MKKRILALALAMLMLVVLVAACGGDDDDNGGGGGGGGGAASGGTYTYPEGPRGEGLTINLWSFTPEISEAVAYYKEQNPDFMFNINPVVLNDQDGTYEAGINAALLAGGADMPHFYAAEQGFVVNYTKFDYADHALPYEDLFGTDPAAMIEAAEISNIIKEAGTNLNGKVVALGFQNTGSAFIYRRSLAIDIWGTDDPDTVAGKIGPGYGKFLEAAAEAKEKGIKIVSGEEDVWQAMRQTPNLWIQNDKLVIDDQKLRFLDIGYELYTNDYTNKANCWSPDWTAAMAGTAPAPVLGFLGPAWLINYCIAPGAGDTFGDWAVCLAPEPFAWGGSYSMCNKDASDDIKAGVAEIIYWLTLDTSNTGFQYLFANQLMPGASAKDAVASGVVMAKSDGKIDFLSGQNMFDIFIPASATGTASGWGPYDRDINAMYLDHARTYFSGDKTKDEAIENFKQDVLDKYQYGS